MIRRRGRDLLKDLFPDEYEFDAITNELVDIKGETIKTRIEPRNEIQP